MKTIHEGDAMQAIHPRPRKAKPTHDRSSVAIPRGLLSRLNGVAKHHDVRVGSLAETLLADGLDRIERREIQIVA